MKQLKCPQCEIHRFYVKNESGENILVTVNESLEIVPVHSSELLDGFDLTTIYCLGCSWQGSPQSLRGGKHKKGTKSY